MALAKYWYLLVVLMCLCLVSVFYTVTPTEQIKVYKNRIADLERQLAQAMQQIPVVSSHNPCSDDKKEAFDREKNYLCTHTQGGVGNFMFAFASVYGMASYSNKTVVIQKDNPLIKYFRVKAKVVDDICVCDKAKFVYEGKHCAFNADLLNLTEHRNYRPGYYFQSWKYFKHVENDIRRQFTFKEQLQQKARDILQMKIQAFKSLGSYSNGTSRPLVTIGVHVRKGDIETAERFVKYGYLVPPAQYFHKAMTYFRTKYKETLFLVCSDDMMWCKKNITGSDVMYVEGNSFDVDLAILSHCNHSVISVGTFGWWGAFLAEGETIYYKHPARNGSSLRQQFSNDLSDYFYPNWISME